MADNINENKKGTEREPGGFENGNESFENVIGENREKEAEIIEKFDDLDNEIEKKIPEVFGGGASSEKKKIIDEEKIVKKEASEIKGEYDQAIDEITGKEVCLSVGEDDKNLTADENNGIEHGRIVSIEELAGFREKITEKIRRRAKEIGMTEQEIVDIAELDLESLDSEKLNNLNLRQKELEFIGYDLEESINKAGMEDDPDKCIEFIKKHKGIISLSQLILYLSTFGAMFLKSIEDNMPSITIEISESKYSAVSTKDLIKNPELMKLIESGPNENSPIDVIKYFKDPRPLEFGNGSLKLINADFGNATSNGTKDVFILYPSLKNENGYTKYYELKEELVKNGLDFWNKEMNGIGADVFYKNKEKFAELTSKYLEIPREQIDDYISEFTELNMSKISVVPFEEIRFDNNTDFSTGNMIDMNSEIIDDFKSFKMTKENFDVEKNFDKFEDEFFKIVENEGESLDSLKKTGEKDPKKLIEKVSEIIAKNIKYDYQEKSDIEKKDFSGQQEKHSKGISYITLKEGSGVCHDTARVLAAALYVLEKNGVKNLDKIAILATSASDMGHEWNIILKLEKKNDAEVVVEMTFIDLTVADDDNPANVTKVPEKLNAVDDLHYYTSAKEKINKSNEAISHKIMHLNKFINYAKLQEALMQYDASYRSLGIEKVKTKE